jgi:hypothetical protein
VLRFYSPLFSFLGGTLTLLTAGNLLLALRILLVLLQLLSAPAMYFLLLKMAKKGKRREEPVAFGPALGTIAYLVIPWRTLYLSGCANYPQALVYPLLPLAFLVLEDILQGSSDGTQARTLRSGLLLGLWVGLLFLAHLVYAVFTLLFLALRWLANRPRRAPGEWRALSAAVLACTGISAFFLLPFVVEQGSHRFPIAHLNLGVPDWMVVLGLKSRVGGYAGAYLGLVVVLLLVVAIVGMKLRRRIHGLVAALFSLAISLYLTFGPSLLKKKQYLITAGLPPERFLVFVIFLSALLIPNAYEPTRSALARLRLKSGVTSVLLAGAVIIDCLPPVFGAAYADRREILAVREDIYPIINAKSHARLLDLNIPEPRVDDARRTLRLPTVGVIYGGLPSPLGPPHHQFAPRSMLHAYPWVDYIAGDLGDTAAHLISEDTHKALALMGVSHIITLPAVVSIAGTDSGSLFLLLKNQIDWDDRFVAPSANRRSHSAAPSRASCWPQAESCPQPRIRWLRTTPSSWCGTGDGCLIRCGWTRRITPSTSYRPWPALTPSHCPACPRLKLTARGFGTRM